jgi:hypothetical protein
MKKKGKINNFYQLMLSGEFFVFVTFGLEMLIKKKDGVTAQRRRFKGVGVNCSNCDCSKKPVKPIRAVSFFVLSS